MADRKGETEDDRKAREDKEKTSKFINSKEN
jgi:hypothetical protein